VTLPLWDVEIPEVEVHTYCFPDPAETGEDHEKLCDEPTSQVKLTGRLLYEYETPSTVNIVPEASDESPDVEKVTVASL
jgi:hypothetical protein